MIDSPIVSSGAYNALVASTSCLNLSSSPGRLASDPSSTNQQGTKERSRSLGSSGCINSNKDFYASVMRSSFMKVDEQFMNENKHLIKTCATGACGLSVLIRDDHLYVCNLGDSRVLLGSENDQIWTQKLLTNDHNTNNERERELVKQRTTDPFPIRGSMAGRHEGNRVGGVLMVTRGFGDGLFKRRDMSMHPFIEHLPYITNEPEITIHKITPQDKYVVISSDGLYEYFTPADVALFVQKYL